MNYYDAREKKDNTGTPSGSWHYTYQNDDLIRPVGYCADGCPGHDSKDGAYQHQRAYDLDHARYDVEHLGSWHECLICKALTNKAAAVGIGGMATYNLCDEHRNREALEQLYTGPGVIMSSF
jgi:hypothetical protein